MGGSPYFTFINYLTYRSKAVGGHSIHSPFVFKLYNEVIRRSSAFRIVEIEAVRKKYRSNHQVIDVTDFKNNSNQRKTISSIAKSSLSSSKFSAFLHLLINELGSKTVLETGTSLGVNALYMAYSSASKVVTMEASPILSQLAKKAFAHVSGQKLVLEFGEITKTFVPSIVRYQPDLVFLDADHRGITIRKQVDQLMEHINPACIVIHDIYWSRDMNQIWNELVEDKRFNLSIDIFKAGVLFTSKGLEKQHFTLRF